MTAVENDPYSQKLHVCNRQNLSVRNRQAELMDQPGLGVGEHRAALDALGRGHRLLRTVDVLWAHIRELAAEAGTPLRVLDVACGGGDVAVGLWRKSVAVGTPIVMDGCDISPVAIAPARELASRRRANVDFFERDVLRQPLPREYDVVVTSLFLHHLSQADAVRLLRDMADSARLSVLVVDQLRSRSNYWLSVAATRLVTRSRVARVDGPLSVEGAFTVDETQALAAAAQLDDVVIRKLPPFGFGFVLSVRGNGDQLSHAGATADANFKSRRLLKPLVKDEP